MTQVPTSDLTFTDVIRVLRRRRTVVIVTALCILVCAVGLSIVTTRRYEAVSIIQIQKTNTDSLNLGSLVGEAAGGAGDALSANIDLQTQADILQSDELALTVIEKNHLEENVDYVAHFDVISFLLRLITPHGAKDNAGLSLRDSPGRREHALTVFHKDLRVTLKSGTRLISVAYSNPNPKVASEVVNSLVAALTEYTFQTKFLATDEVSKWLETKLGDLRKQSEDLQTKVVAMQRTTGLFGVGGSDLQGRPMVYSPVLDRLEQSNSALAQAESNNMLKGAIARVAKSGNADLISELSGTTMSSAASQGVAASLSLIESLRLQETTLEQSISRDSTVFGPAYPRLVEEQAALAGVQRSLSEETQRIATRAQNDADIAERAANDLRRRYEANKSEAETLNNRTISYVLLSKEAGQSEDLYRDLLKRLREAGIVEGLRSSNISVVSLARAPAAPAKPNVPMYLLIGIAGGIFAGIASAFLFDAVDNKVQGPDEVEAQGITLLGVLPVFPVGHSTDAPQFLANSKASYSEAIRALRSNLLISRGGAPPQLILVTSGGAGEGKSTVSTNLALSLAQMTKKVLLVEIDLRRPVLQKRLGLPKSGGLSTYLSNADLPVQTRTIPAQPNLEIIIGGPVPPFPAELLASARMSELIKEWRSQYDFIVLDAPPILPVADVQTLVGSVDAAVLVVRADRTSRTTLSRARTIMTAHQLQNDPARIGVVLNAISHRSSAYYGYYGYYGRNSYYTYGEKEKTNA